MLFSKVAVEQVPDMVNDGAFALHCRLAIVFPYGNHRTVQFLHTPTDEIEGSYRGKTSSVVRLVFVLFLGPVFIFRVKTIVGGDAVGAEVAWVAVARIGKIALGTHRLGSAKAVTAIL